MIVYELHTGDGCVIEQIDFAILSDKDIVKQSVVEVTDTTIYTRGVPTTNGLNDLRMGNVL